MRESRADDALFEHRFWLQILGDHSRFILNSLAPRETADIRRAQQFIDAFDRLLAEARTATVSESLTGLNREALSQAVALRAFKLDLLARHLTGKLQIMLTPSFLNHMVNELEEYLRILEALAAGRPVPRFEPLHHDLLWLSDAYGHASAISSNLDMTEKRLISKSKDFEKHFEAFYLKAVEMAGFIRTGLRDYPAFRRFHAEVNLEMQVFVRFLNELEEAEISAAVLDRIQPLIPDHMMREECYYLTKLAQSGLVPQPACDPAKPRTEG